MSLTLKEELRRTFERATLRREAKYLQTPRQWAQANELMIRADIARERETRLFTERYDTRVEASRRRLIDAAGAPVRLLQPKWIGLDRFDATDLLRQAQREVRAHHDRRMSGIDDAEARILAAIVRRAEQENALMGMACEAFERVADPNRDPDQRRRIGPIRH